MPTPSSLFSKTLQVTHWHGSAQVQVASEYAHPPADSTPLAQLSASLQPVDSATHATDVKSSYHRAQARPPDHIHTTHLWGHAAMHRQPVNVWDHSAQQRVLQCVLHSLQATGYAVLPERVLDEYNVPDTHPLYSHHHYHV